MAIQSPSSEKVLVAYIESFNKISEKNIRDFLSSLLPKYMIPSFFIFLDKIPINHNGKKDLKILPSPFKSLKIKKDKPKTFLEKQVLKIWSKVLGYKNIGRDDNFFRIGGDSIKAMQVVLSIKKNINSSVKNFQLFENSTFKGFVRSLENQNDLKIIIKKRVNKSPTITSENQESLWIIDRLNPSSFSYILNFPFILEGNLDIKKFLQALDIIIQRHESLRTYFGKINSELMQYIEEKISNYFEYFECDSEK